MTIKRCAYSLYIFLIPFFLLSCGNLAKKDPVFVSDVQPALSVTELRDLTQDDVRNLRKYASTNNVYFIVHPSYYAFFYKKSPRVTPENGKNVVESLIEKDISTVYPVKHLMREYERLEMEFISSAKKDKKLIILVLPGEYSRAKYYRYRKGDDEYARYLNDVTRGSSSVFYIETKRSDSGKISKGDRHVLRNFLKQIDAQNIYVGGGYIGRCQEEFYKTLKRIWPKDKLAIVPEISAFSPQDITESTAKMLLTADMKLNSWAVKYYIKNQGLKTLDTRVNIKNITEVNNSNSTR